MWIDRPRPTLYEVTVTDAATDAVLLRTVLFREEPGR